MVRSLEAEGRNKQLTGGGKLLKIGLTGGAATGKSTVVSILKELGAYIIDLDLIAREVVEKGSPCLEEIAAQFGKDMLRPDGGLDRKKLGDLVFSDRDKLRKLNSIVHPVMIDRVEKELAELEKRSDIPAVVIDAAILIEASGKKEITEEDKKKLFAFVEPILSREEMEQLKNLLRSFE